MGLIFVALGFIYIFFGTFDIEVLKGFGLTIVGYLMMIRNELEALNRNAEQRSV